MKCTGVVFCILNLVFCITATACGPRRIALPTDPGAPFPDFAAVHKQVSSACSGVRTFTAELSLRGRVAEQRLSGRVIAGFAPPASMRLEGLAPIGQPIFHLAAQGGNGVLWLPRDQRVLRGQPAEAILDALIGVNLAPADLQAILTGCVVQKPTATAGRLHADGWASIDLQGGAQLYLRRAGEWQLRAARRDGWQLEYAPGQSMFPASVRLVSRQQSVPVDLTAALSQLESNVDLEESVFRVNVPASAETLTLEELRESGPLRVQ
jgi:hypothetical protein